MAEVEITTAPPAIVEITGDDGEVIEVPVAAATQVEVLTEGVQGSQGLRGDPGANAIIPDPGDLILYLENGLT